jgi:hypothetical protein
MRKDKFPGTRSLESAVAIYCGMKILAATLVVCFKNPCFARGRKRKLQHFRASRVLRPKAVVHQHLLCRCWCTTRFYSSTDLWICLRRAIAPTARFAKLF